MDDPMLGSLWGFGQQQIIDELKKELFQTTFELERMKKEAQENMTRNAENVQQLLSLLNVVYQERDEARSTLQSILNILLPLRQTELNTSALPSLQLDSVRCSTGENSSITPSDSAISETCDPHPYISTPIDLDPFFDMGSPTDITNVNIANSNNFQVQEYNNSPNATSIVSWAAPEPDQASVIIDNLVQGKSLPEKGKLLQTVMEVPLLQLCLPSHLQNLQMSLSKKSAA